MLKKILGGILLVLVQLQDLWAANAVPKLACHASDAGNCGLTMTATGCSTWCKNKGYQYYSFPASFQGRSGVTTGTFCVCLGNSTPYNSRCAPTSKCYDSTTRYVGSGYWFAGPRGTSSIISMFSCTSFTSSDCNANATWSVYGKMMSMQPYVCSATNGICVTSGGLLLKCLRNYYGNPSGAPTNGFVAWYSANSGMCASCPTLTSSNGTTVYGSTVSVGTSFVSGCYQRASLTFKDTAGNFVFNSSCFYS